MVQYPLNVDDFSCQLRTAENKIIILRTVVLRTETTGFFCNFPAYNKEMTNIIVGSQKMQIETRFEMRLEIFGKISPYLVLIGIKNINGRILFQTDRNLKECIRRKQIIMVHKSDKLSCRCSKRCVRILCNTDIFRNQNIFHARILFGILFQHTRHCLVLRAGISDHQLPVRIALLFQ